MDTQTKHPDTGIISGIAHRFDPHFEPELLNTLSGMLEALCYTNIAVSGQPEQPYTLAFNYRPETHAYGFTVSADTGSFEKSWDVPVSKFRGLLDMYGETRRNTGMQHTPYVRGKLHQQRCLLKDRGAMILQTAFAHEGVRISADTATSLFRVMASELTAKRAQQRQ